MITILFILLLAVFIVGGWFLFDKYRLVSFVPTLILTFVIIFMYLHNGRHL